MSQKSLIEWTDATWNPVTGCTKVSPGCQNCYAERFAERWRGISGHSYEQGFDLRLWPERLNMPLKWKTSCMIFVNSMSDLFHEDIPLSYIKEVFKIMEQAWWHTFQIVTKRAKRLAEVALEIDWPSNVWIGVSVETSAYIWRIDMLENIPASIRFISIEPLLGHLDSLPLNKIDWVIVGGESGPNARSVNPEWVRSIRDQCLAKKVPFFFKQWGGANKKKSGRALDDRVWNEMPSIV